MRDGFILAQSSEARVNLTPMSIGLLGRLADEVSHPEKSVASRTGPARVHAWPYQVELGPE